MRELSVSWAIDRMPVPLEWSSANIEAPGGYGALEGVVVPERMMPLQAGPFSSIVGTRSDGEPFYRGEIVSLPKDDRGLVGFRVQGVADRLLGRKEHRLYQLQGPSQFVAGDAEDHRGGNYSMFKHYDVNVRDGLIVFVVAAATYSTNQRAQVIYFAEEELITRVAFDVDRSDAMTNFDIEIGSAEGPDGAVTLEDLYNLTGTGTVNVDTEFGTPSTQLHIRIVANGASSPAEKRRVTIRNLRVNGRTLLDRFSLWDLTEDLVAEFDWENLSPHTTENILPQDWLDAWDAELTKAAELDDGTWVVTDPANPFSDQAAGLYVGPWGRNEFTVRDADYSDTEALLPANKAVVSYEKASGLVKVVTAEPDLDPYAGEGIVVTWPEEDPYHVEGPRLDPDEIRRLTRVLAERHAAPQVRGRIPITRLYAADGDRHPWDLFAADDLELAGYELPPLFRGEPLPAQRVTQVRRNPDGTAEATVGADLSIPALIERVNSKKKHRKRRRRVAGSYVGL